MEVEKRNKASAASKHTARPHGDDRPKSNMAAPQSGAAGNPVDKTQTRAATKYRILPKLLSGKRWSSSGSPKESSELGKTGFHVRVSPLATSTPKEVGNGRVVSPQTKRTESRAKRLQYLSGDGVPVTQDRDTTVPYTERKFPASSPKQAKTARRPCSSPGVRTRPSAPVTDTTDKTTNTPDIAYIDDSTVATSPESPTTPCSELSESCKSNNDVSARPTPSPTEHVSLSPGSRQRVTETAKTVRDKKSEHGVVQSKLTTSSGPRIPVHRVTSPKNKRPQEINANGNKDRHKSLGGVNSSNASVSTGKGVAREPHLLSPTSATSTLPRDVVSTAMSRTVSHNDALGKSVTFNKDSDWAGSAPEHMNAGNVRSSCASPDAHRTASHSEISPDRRRTALRVVRSRSDVFSCGSPTSRPVVDNCVKLVREGRSSKFAERCRPHAPPPSPPTRASLSVDDIDASRLILLSTRSSFTFSGDRGSNLRSSFMMPSPKTPPNEPTKNESECDDKDSDFVKSDGVEIYSLPQPMCYSEDTMKAIKQITDKYDTLQRRRLQAMSFREPGRRKASDRTLASTSGGESDPAIADYSGVSTERPPDGDTVGGTTDEVFDADADVCLSAGITQRDIARLELFYGSRDTEVIVCRCLADVLFSDKGDGSDRSTPDGWRHANTGIPVFVLNTGRGTRKRDLKIVLAERETGFALWQDKITYLSTYTNHEGAAAFHTMQHSSRPIGELAGLRFHEVMAANDFHARFVRLTSDPTDELWRVGVSGRRKSSTKRRWRLSGKSDAATAKSTMKRDISQPCNFEHVTKVKQLEPRLMSSLADMIARTVSRRVVRRSVSSRPSSYTSIASST